MRKPKSYSVLEVFNFSNIGLIYEFYSTKNSKFIADEIGRLVGKQLIITGDDKIIPSYVNAVLLKEYNAPRVRYQLKFAQQNYHAIFPIIESVTKWINENCETTSDTHLKAFLSFDHKNFETLYRISTMNPVKLILKFDENEVYKRFPEQRKSPYALSIKKLAPIKTYINESNIKDNIKHILTTPYAEYHGIDFKNYTQGILGCNYIGGTEYSSKQSEIKQLLEYFIIKVYQSINDYENTSFEEYEIKKLTENFNKIQLSYFDPDVFLNEFSNIKVYVDLQTSRQIIKTFWSHIRQPLFEMITNGELRKGEFNFDSEIGRIQLRNGNLNGTFISDIDLFKCKLSGVFENCEFTSCDIKKSRIYKSNFIYGNNINESYLGNVNIKSGNTLNKSFVLNNEEVINCKVNESVIKFATISQNFTSDNKTTIIVKEEQLPKLSDAIKIEEIRDYAWIKKMNPNISKQGFANEYIKDKYKKGLN